MPVADGQVLPVELVGVEAGPAEAERRQQPGPDELVVEDAGRHRHHPAEDRVAEVGVLEPGPRRPVERDPGRQQLVERGDRQPLLPVPHGSSVGNPAVIVSSCLIVTGAASADPPVQPASSGTYWAAGSSSASAPASRSSRMADAVNDLDMDAIRNAVSASGGPAPRDPGAESGAVHELAAGHDPVGDRGLPAPAGVVADDGVRRREIVGREMVTPGHGVYGGVTRHTTILARRGHAIIGPSGYAAGAPRDLEDLTMSSQDIPPRTLPRRNPSRCTAAAVRADHGQGHRRREVPRREVADAHRLRRPHRRDLR